MRVNQDRTIFDGPTNRALCGYPQLSATGATKASQHAKASGLTMQNGFQVALELIRIFH